MPDDHAADCSDHHDADDVDAAVDHVDRALGLLDPIDEHLDGAEQHLHLALEHLDRARAGRLPGRRAPDARPMRLDDPAIDRTVGRYLADHGLAFYRDPDGTVHVRPAGD
jgi:hypothetical protein